MPFSVSYTFGDMQSPAKAREHVSSRPLLARSTAAIITLFSTVLMLWCASPELSRDEADYATNVAYPWSFLWSRADYERHGHGPMMIYLAKLGNEVLPKATGSLEARLRFFDALVGSVGVGFLYWILRESFKTSQAAALAGCSLLLFSVTRLKQTDIFGPHHLMLACTLAIIGLGYEWRDRPSLQAGLAIGAVMGLGALSMTYVIPAALCWALAIGLAGREWIAWDRMHIKVSWFTAGIVATGTIVALALWPPGVLQHVIISNFRWYLHYPYAVALVGNRIVEHAPRWAALYWLGQLEVPILVVCVPVISIALWKALSSRSLLPKHTYLAVCLAFFLVTALSAHLSGPRNLLQFIGVLCLATGALFDEAVGQRLIRITSAIVMVLAVLNLVWLSHRSGYAPVMRYDGYRAFVKENESRLDEKTEALVFNVPALQFYAREESSTAIRWHVNELPWTTRADAPLPANIRYVLMPEFVYTYMPPEQPMRRVVAEHWNLVWSHKRAHCWDLRLYENPQVISVRSELNSGWRAESLAK
jgi:hypothetical protein